MNKAVFYHAGCPVCVNAEERITELVDRNKYDVEFVHLAGGGFCDAVVVGHAHRGADRVY